MHTPWEAEIAQLLTDISTVQDEIFIVLNQKREMLLKTDLEGLSALAPRDEDLIARLQACLKRREELLTEAQQEGLPGDSIRSLTGALPPNRRGDLPQRLMQTGARARLLQHQSLTNWMVTQWALIHLSQLIEIIATGGHLQPTYGEREPVNASGGLVDRAA
ncbi:MAG: flagellar export chaperone FlgN [Pirellulales bacterium]|nr:flagellar export chaperone FlgN [Pirellulales bacterium]